MHKSLTFIMAYWCLVASEILVNIGSGNGLFACRHKLKADPMFMYHLQNTEDNVCQLSG